MTTARSSTRRASPPASQEPGAAVATVRRADRTVAEVGYRAELAGAELLLGTAVRSAGLALEHVAAQERAEQAQVAEVRATQAERDRDAAARTAVAEERARIARELHDIVAHAAEMRRLLGRHAQRRGRHRPDAPAGLDVLGALTGSPGNGHGLAGIRERVKIYGGEMTAGTARGGGLVLSACLPLGSDPR